MLSDALAIALAIALSIVGAETRPPICYLVIQILSYAFELGLANRAAGGHDTTRSALHISQVSHA